MIKPISKIEAFALLLDEQTADKVYVKRLGEYSYLHACGYRFSFGNDKNAINAHLAEFYVEDKEWNYAIKSQKINENCQITRTGISN